VILELVHSRPEHRSALEAFFDQNALLVAKRGVLVDTLEHLAVSAWSEGQLAGARLSSASRRQHPRQSPDSVET